MNTRHYTTDKKPKNISSKRGDITRIPHNPSFFCWRALRQAQVKVPQFSRKFLCSLEPAPTDHGHTDLLDSRPCAPMQRFLKLGFRVHSKLQFCFEQYRQRSISRSFFSTDKAYRSQNKRQLQRPWDKICISGLNKLHFAYPPTLDGLN